VLRFGSCDAVLSFLPEHEIPRDFHKAIEEVQLQLTNTASWLQGCGGGDRTGQGEKACLAWLPAWLSAFCVDACILLRRIWEEDIGCKCVWRGGG
jgi:hypothetical protein